jgi:uncharacterized membrane protein
MNKNLPSENAILRTPARLAGGWGILSTEMDRLLFLSVLFSCLLTTARVLRTEHHYFAFLVWNLFLAYIPYLISTYLTRLEARRGVGHPTGSETKRGVSRPENVQGVSHQSRLEVKREVDHLASLEAVQGAGHQIPPETNRGLTRLTGMKARGAGRGLGWWTLALLWLLFIPNSFYIITDLYHLEDLHQSRNMPQWFDLAMILSFVWNGLLLGVLSVRQMERLFFPRLTLVNELLFLYPVMWLNALGIYIGRYLRYNSWDIVTDPFRLLRDIAMMVVHPLRHHDAWDMVLCFSILMTLIYLMMKRISKALT